MCIGFGAREFCSLPANLRPQCVVWFSKGELESKAKPNAHTHTPILTKIRALYRVFAGNKTYRYLRVNNVYCRNLQEAVTVPAQNYTRCAEATASKFVTNVSRDPGRDERKGRFFFFFRIVKNEKVRKKTEICRLSRHHAVRIYIYDECPRGGANEQHSTTADRARAYHIIITYV